MKENVERAVGYLHLVLAEGTDWLYPSEKKAIRDTIDTLENRLRHLGGQNG
jgi:hypothetical protein